MYSKTRQAARGKELENEIESLETAYKSGNLEHARYKGQLQRIAREFDEMKAERDLHMKANAFAGAADAAMGQMGYSTSFSDPTGSVQGYGYGSEQASGSDAYFISAPTIADVPRQQFAQLFAAAENKTPYSFQVEPKRVKSFNESIRFKTAGAPALESSVSSSLTGQLPPVQSPYAVGIGYESCSVASLLPAVAMPGPSATWLSHTGNTNEVAVVGENASKPSLGPTLVENQVVPQKMAGTVEISLELWEDSARYGQAAVNEWMPIELTRSHQNTISNQLLNAVSGTGGATFDGLTQLSGTLTRAVGTDTPLDALAKAFVDVRTGSAFADPDLVIMHPATLGALRRWKDADGRYILDLLAGPLNLTADGHPRINAPASDPNSYSVVPQGLPGLSGNLWGAPIATTTQIAAGTALVMSVAAGAAMVWYRMALRLEFNMWSDVQWTQNQFSFRAESRLALSSPRPTALNILTGLPES